MKIAVPTSNGLLSPHFGHCEQFVLVDVDEGKREIKAEQVVSSPEHAPGLLPEWLNELGVNLVIAGGIGARAQTLFREKGIEVIAGAPVAPPVEIVKAYLDGTLETGPNVCDH